MPVIRPCILSLSNLTVRADKKRLRDIWFLVQWGGRTEGHACWKWRNWASYLELFHKWLCDSGQVIAIGYTRCRNRFTHPFNYSFNKHFITCCILTILLEVGDKLWLVVGRSISKHDFSIVLFLSKWQISKLYWWDIASGVLVCPSINLLFNNKSKWSNGRDFPASLEVNTSPSNIVGPGLIPAWGNEIVHASWPENQNIQWKQYCNKFNWDFKIVHVKKLTKIQLQISFKN